MGWWLVKIHKSDTECYVNKLIDKIILYNDESYYSVVDSKKRRDYLIIIVIIVQLSNYLIKHLFALDQ